MLTVTRESIRLYLYGDTPGEIWQLFYVIFFDASVETFLTALVDSVLVPGFSKLKLGNPKPFPRMDPQGGLGEFLKLV